MIRGQDSAEGEVYTVNGGGISTGEEGIGGRDFYLVWKCPCNAVSMRHSLFGLNGRLTATLEEKLLAKQADEASKQTCLN